MSKRETRKGSCIRCRWGYWIIASLILSAATTAAGFFMKLTIIGSIGVAWFSTTLFPFAFLWFICEEGERTPPNSVGY